MLLLGVLGCKSGMMMPLDRLRLPPQARQDTAELSELGAMLFFDPRLSGLGTMSCASCHSPELGFGDGLERSLGVHGEPMRRHTPHLFNLAWSRTFFWDGRAETLEDQARGPLNDPVEMDSSEALMVERLGAVPGYQEGFTEAFGDAAVTEDRVVEAIAAFERTLVVDDAPFDRYVAGDPAAMSAAAVRGLALFRGEANCEVCHSGPNLTDQLFHNTGVPGIEDDLGRGELDKVGEFHQSPYAFFNTYRAFKTPSLRNVAETAPYMHNGSLETLEDVVRFYNAGGLHPDTQGRSRDVHPLNLTDEEIQDLIAFLEALTTPFELTPPAIPAG